jgi:DNA-binding Xre family transcriptional regulator
MNAIELKKKMLDNGDNNRKLAKYLGISESTLSCKIHENGASFRKAEISKIISRYDLSGEDVSNIFF